MRFFVNRFLIIKPPKYFGGLNYFLFVGFVKTSLRNLMSPSSSEQINIKNPISKRPP